MSIVWTILIGFVQWSSNSKAFANAQASNGAGVSRRLAGVPDPELHVVDAVERQEVGRLGVGVRVDMGAGRQRREADRHPR